MATIEKFCPPSVYDPPGYSQGIKVTGAQSIPFLAGQVAYDKDGGVAHRGPRPSRLSDRGRGDRDHLTLDGRRVEDLPLLRRPLEFLRQTDIAPYPEPGASAEHCPAVVRIGGADHEERGCLPGRARAPRRSFFSRGVTQTRR